MAASLQIFGGQLAAAEPVGPLVGGLLSSLVFVLALTAINNFEAAFFDIDFQARFFPEGKLPLAVRGAPRQPPGRLRNTGVVGGAGPAGLVFKTHSPVLLRSAPFRPPVLNRPHVSPRSADCPLCGSRRCQHRPRRLCDNLVGACRTCSRPGAAARRSSPRSSPRSSNSDLSPPTPPNPTQYSLLSRTPLLPDQRFGKSIRQAQVGARLSGQVRHRRWPRINHLSVRGNHLTRCGRCGVLCCNGMVVSVLIAHVRKIHGGRRAACGAGH